LYLTRENTLEMITSNDIIIIILLMYD